MKIARFAEHMNFVDEIAQLHQTEWAHTDRSFTLDSRKAALTEAAGREGIPSIFIAIDKNEFIGSAALVGQDLDTHSELSPWISAVFVKEKWRKQGIASLLVERCEAEARKMGVQKLYLSTEFASALYKKLGWQTIETCVHKGVKLDVMCKNIAP